MGLLVMWTMTGILVVSAVVSVRVIIVHQSRSELVQRYRNAVERERVIRTACADLDAEYRELTRR